MNIRTDKIMGLPKMDNFFTFALSIGNERQPLRMRNGKKQGLSFGLGLP